MEYATKNLQCKGLPPSQRQSSFGNQAYQKLSRPLAAPNISNEEPYGNVFKEEPYLLHNKSSSTNSSFKEKNVKRRSSRFGLAGLFSKSKPMDIEEKQETLGTQWEEDEPAYRSTTVNTETSNTPFGESASEEIGAFTPVESSGIQLQHKTSKSALKARTSFKKETSHKSIPSWNPPPLFQAYPQAIKHSTLIAPYLSAEAILRLYDSRGTSTHLSSDFYTSDLNPPKSQKEKRLKRHTAAEVLSKGDWTHKIFMLVTSGYLLQYAGDGNFDRLPEKIMPLTTESAAFASDAIPGQPYVLQISQVTDDQGTLDKDASRSMLKKLGLRHEMKRSTSTFLLVLQSPEDMGAWLVAVKREIQAIGGKEYKPDDLQVHDIGKAIQPLHQRPSQRYLVSRDPNRFSEKAWDPPSTMETLSNQRPGNPATESTAIPIPASCKRQSLATQSSMESRSVSNTTSSINQFSLDQLKESPRESYASMDAKTASTSRGSSPRLLPGEPKTEIPDLSCAFAARCPTTTSYSKIEHNSIQGYSGILASVSETSQPSLATSPPPQSARSTPASGRTPSPAAPNFSVPTFSKRYSTANSCSASSYTRSKPQTPPIKHRELPIPPIMKQEGIIIEKRKSATSGLQHLRSRSPSASNRVFGIDSDPSFTLPRSSGSCNLPSSSDGEKRFSRRFSSLEHSRGVSPVQSARQLPSPYPPPTAALPPIPGASPSYRASLCQPPSTPLPPIPSVGKLPQRYSMLPSSSSAAPQSLPAVSLSSRPRDTAGPPKTPPICPECEVHPDASFATTPVMARAEVHNEVTSEHPSCPYKSARESMSTESHEPWRPRRSDRREAHNDDLSKSTPSTTHPTGPKTAFEAEGLTPPLDGSPPKPTREPPPPPSPQGEVKACRSTPRIGREPPPVYSPATSPKPRISVSSRAESYFDGPAPHPFIPPIRVSERKFRGSLDGPWNISYEAPQRTFLDLSVA